MQKRGIVDLSSVIWTCLRAGKDREFGRKYEFEGKEILVNSAQYGFENAVNHLITVMDDLKIQPRDLIFVPEGMNAKAERLFIFAGYKAGRAQHEAWYEQFNIVKENLLTMFKNMGAQVCWQDGGVEGDDVVGYLAQNLNGERYIISGDKDMAVCTQWPGVHHLRQGVLDKNPFGPFNPKFIPVCIALVGDDKDKIPGCRNFGDTAFIELLGHFGDDGLELMEELILQRRLDRLVEDVAKFPKLKRIIEDAENVYMSYELGRLRLEKINTLRRPLNWKVGMVKPVAVCQDDRLRKYHGQVKIVSAENYDVMLKWAREQIPRSPYVTLDVESSTPPESDEWLEAMGKEEKVDVFGQELTSLQMTFGPNMQFTVYLPVDNVEEDGCTNLTCEQVAAFVDLVPRHLFTIAHNAAFELPVCYMAWGELWAGDDLHHGFLRNCIDSSIMSSYADENKSKGLKSLSLDLLEYEQESYEHVTTKHYAKGDWNGVGKLKQTYFEPTLVEGEPDIERVVIQHKMNQLTARQVLGYGADDPICTAAVTNHFMCILEIEKTWNTFMEVEQWPAYLTALAFVQGTKFDLQHMKEMQDEDDKAYDEAWPILRSYLMKIGFDGTVCPVFPDTSPASVKAAFAIIEGHELTFKVRMPDKVAKLLEQEADEADAEAAMDSDSRDGSAIRLLAGAVRRDDVAQLNELVKSRFIGEPTLDLGSPPQIARLLYDHMGVPLKILNEVTVIERIKNPPLAEAMKKFKAIRAGKTGLALSDEELKLLRKKASGNDTAVDWALAFNTDVLGAEEQAALRAFGVMKKVKTRRDLFYSIYSRVLHWKDGKVHANANQCAAVTRRYSMNMPNLQQLPKDPVGVRFRGGFKPHHRNAVVASIDFVGQELRLAAERSQDKNMLACYVGDNLKDIHSITAAGAMVNAWGDARVAELFATHGAGLPRNSDGRYQLFLRLVKGLDDDNPLKKEAAAHRKSSKNVNFAAQNGAFAAKISETEIMPFADAQMFLDAREEMFPGVAIAAERAADEAGRSGYAATMMGARRHLRAGLLSDERGAAQRAARQAWSMEIQGSAGEMTKLGMARLWLSNIYFRYDARFIAPIHDELVSSVSKDDAVNFLREKNACMTAPYSTMKVPILGSISIGPDFAKQIECGDWFIEERITSALNVIFKEKETA